MSLSHVPDYSVSIHKEAVSCFWSSVLLCSYCSSSPACFLRCWLSRSRCSIVHSAVTYSGICFSHMCYSGLITKAFHLLFFYPGTQCHDILLQLSTVSLMTTDHFASTPILVTSLLTLSSQSSMSRLDNRCCWIGSVESQHVPLLLAPHNTFILLKSNTFCLSIKKNQIIHYRICEFLIIASLHHWSNFQVASVWTILLLSHEQYFWWPVSSMPKPSVLFYSHRKKSESEDFRLQINSRQIPPTCDSMQNWMKNSWFGAGGDVSIGKKLIERPYHFTLKEITAFGSVLWLQ